MKMERSPLLASKAESPFLQHFKDQPGYWLCCVVRERIPAREDSENDDYDSRTMTVERDYLDRDLAGYLFHHYSIVGGLPVFEKYEGSR